MIAFSAVLPALALPVFGHLVGGRLVKRLSLVAAAGAGLSSVANIVEDGLRMAWAFYLFVLGGAIVDLSLLVLTMVIVFVCRGGRRLLALIPAGTLAGIVLYVAGGGPILADTRLAAGVVALVAMSRSRSGSTASVHQPMSVNEPSANQVR